MAAAARASCSFNADTHDKSARSGTNAAGKAPAHVAADGGTSGGYAGAARVQRVPGEAPGKTQRVSGGGGYQSQPPRRALGSWCNVRHSGWRAAPPPPRPLQPTRDLLLKLLEGGPRPTSVMSLVRPYKERDHAALAASGARQIRPRRDARDWPVTDNGADTFKEVILVAATAHEAQGIPAAALDKWPAMEGVSAVLLVQAAARTSCTAAQPHSASAVRAWSWRAGSCIASLSCSAGRWSAGGGGSPTLPRQAMCCAYAGGGRRRTATRTWTGSTRRSGVGCPPPPGPKLIL